MGGTFDRLVEQGHEVHVAYQTSGNIAVSDEEALKFAEVSLELNGGATNANQIIKDLAGKREYDVDSSEVRSLKGLIRRKESVAATRYVGIPDEQVHFLDLPFYETGRVKKNKLGEKDVEIMCDIIDKVKPHQIYGAGDLADPHGTHKVCLDALFMALDKLKKNDLYG